MQRTAVINSDPLCESGTEGVKRVAAMTASIQITGGNFPLVQRLFAQMPRIMTIKHIAQGTKEVVEAARESLVIGATYPQQSPE
jgi:hypothetical protein